MTHHDLSSWGRRSEARCMGASDAATAGPPRGSCWDSGQVARAAAVRAAAVAGGSWGECTAAAAGRARLVKKAALPCTTLPSMQG